MTEVKISKARWSRGRQRGNALLISKDAIEDASSGPDDADPLPRHNTMCCLGFACLAKGLSPGDIRGVTMPSAVSARTGKPIDGLSEGDVGGDEFQDTEFAKEAAQINDDPKISDELRILQLQGLTENHKASIKFVFVD